MIDYDRIRELQQITDDREFFEKVHAYVSSLPELDELDPAFDDVKNLQLICQGSIDTMESSTGLDAAWGHSIQQHLPLPSNVVNKIRTTLDSMLLEPATVDMPKSEEPQTDKGQDTANKVKEATNCLIDLSYFLSRFEGPLHPARTSNVKKVNLDDLLKEGEVAQFLSDNPECKLRLATALEKVTDKGMNAGSQNQRFFKDKHKLLRRIRREKWKARVQSMLEPHKQYRKNFRDRVTIFSRAEAGVKAALNDKDVQRTLDDDTVGSEHKACADLVKTDDLSVYPTLVS